MTQIDENSISLYQLGYENINQSMLRNNTYLLSKSHFQMRSDTHTRAILYLATCKIIIRLTDL